MCKTKFSFLTLDFDCNFTDFTHFIGVHLDVLFILQIQPLILAVGGLGGPPPQIFPPPANMAMDFPPPGMVFFSILTILGLT